MASVQDYFQGKHVVITGGSSGIGLAIARRLATFGSRLTLVARRPEPLEAARAGLVRDFAGLEVHACGLDVADEAQIASRLLRHLDANPAEVLINNAGVSMPGRFLEQGPGVTRELMDINFFGAVHMTRALAPAMVERGRGHITNVGSLLSVLSLYGYAAYAASKFALYGFSDALRAELKPQGVQVSLLLPPDTDTPQHAAELEHLPPETRALAQSVKMLSADTVASALLQGMARGRFEIVPGFDGRATVTASRWFPGLVRAYCDAVSRKASAPRVARRANAPS